MMDRDEGVALNLDLMFAIVLLLAGVGMAILTMPTLSHEEKDWRINQYMAAMRATDNLVQDPGEPGWEASWVSGNYSSVKKIGFLYVDTDGKAKQKILNKTKIEALMGVGYVDNITRKPWWEFPNPSTNFEEQENAAKALGLEEYSFYMQLHPVALNLFNSTPLEANLTNRSMVPINNDTVSVVDRYVYIIDPSSSDEIKYIKYDNEAVHYRLNLWVW